MVATTHGCGCAEYSQHLAAHQGQLSNYVNNQLDNINKILNTNFACIDEHLKKSFHNQNLMYHTMATRHLPLEQRFASIEEQLARLGMNPLALIL